ncbi:hypothetical protein LCGC14_3066310, partial [marine sediment metagenome]
WRTECLIEEEEIGVSQIMHNVSQQIRKGIKSDNANKMNYSYNFTFNADSGSHSDTVITGGVLRTDGSAGGIWTSDNKSLDTTAEYYELRATGQTLSGTKYRVSTDGGVVWISGNLLRTQYAFPTAAKNLKVQVILTSADTQINSLVLLYK